MSFQHTITDHAAFIERTLRNPMPHSAPLLGLKHEPRTLTQALAQIAAKRAAQ